ncbi:MAG TPA: hypothetical protein VFR47_33145 [Anaerolineales bacterium]|nr:hypothetical protein [Anaerolineales bacterium]
MARYHERIAHGTRHPGHIDRRDDAAFLNLIRQGPMDWVDIESERLAVDTNVLDKENYQTIAMAVRRFIVLT